MDSIFEFGKNIISNWVNNECFPSPDVFISKKWKTIITMNVFDHSDAEWLLELMQKSTDSLICISFDYSKKIFDITKIKPNVNDILAYISEYIYLYIVIVPLNKGLLFYKDIETSLFMLSGPSELIESCKRNDDEVKTEYFEVLEEPFFSATGREFFVSLWNTYCFQQHSS